MAVDEASPVLLRGIILKGLLLLFLGALPWIGLGALCTYLLG